MFSNFSAMGNSTYGDISSAAVIKISGMSNATINGTIGRCAVITISGMGNVKVNGNVDEGVIFKVSGIGNLSFAKRPPESVVKSIVHSGTGNITMPGGYTAASQFGTDAGANGAIVINSENVVVNGRTYNNGAVANSTRTVRNMVFNNGRTFIDGVEVAGNSSGITIQSGNPRSNGNNNNSNYTNQMTSTATLSTSLVSQPALADDYTEDVRAYIDSFKNKKKLSVQIAELNLTSEEEALFEKFQDPITFNYMDIPVMLNERYYDVSTIATLNNQDPFTKRSFKKENIGAARLMLEKFEKTVKKLNDKRKEASQGVESTSIRKFSR